MLRTFLYLDENLLDQFVGQAEDGLRQTRTRAESSSSTLSGGVGAKVAHGEKASEKEASETHEFVDSPPARFNRLLKLVNGHEDDFGWVTVHSDTDVEAAVVGSVIDVTADLYESDISKMSSLANSLPALSALGALANKTGTAKSFPGQNEIDMVNALSAVTTGITLLGDIADSWRIALVLPTVETSIEGEAQVVGKVTKVVPAGRHEVLPGIPFLESMPREMRRNLVKAGPQPGSEPMWIHGPALIVTAIAVYR